MNKLMTNADLKTFVTMFEKKFEIGIIKDYRPLKLNGEQFLKEAYSLNPWGALGKLDLLKECPKKGNPNSFFLKDKEYRILLGIGVELIAKAALVKEGYVINSYEDRRHIKHLEKFEKVNEKDLSKRYTHKFSFLIENMKEALFQNNLSDDEFNTYIRKGIEIARIWRNKEAHLNCGGHTEQYGEDESIKTALINVYIRIFDEEEVIKRIVDF
ncbi:hypothetical protein HY643_05235 [Candidatus Woesearchaeota archaeon]|nr:hypothetical protein [Candidatus Woesearchaeota archaeon]